MEEMCPESATFASGPIGVCGRAGVSTGAGPIAFYSSLGGTRSR